MFRRLTSLALAFSLIASYAVAQDAPMDDKPKAKPTPVADSGPRTYTVRKGDSLSRIARKFYGNSVLWLPILNANADTVKEGGRLIFPGTELTIPDLNDVGADIRTATVAPESLPLGIVTGNDYAPFTDEKLPEGGLFTELVREATTRAGYAPDIAFRSWDDAMRQTRSGTYKASFPWYDTTDRRAALWYSKPVYEVLIVVYHKAGAPLTFNNIDDLNGLNLCRPDGYFDDDIRAKVEDGQIVRTAPETPANCFELLVEGEVDVVSLSAMVGNGEIIKAGYEEEIEVADIPLAIRPLHIVYPKFAPRSRGVMGKVDLALSAMEKDGTTAKIIEKHLREHFAGLEKARDARTVASNE